MACLPKDAKARKNVPLYTGLLKYFPDALAAVAEVSQIGNEQHNPGTPCHWDRSKSQDELDALTRHLLEAGELDTDGARHSAKVAWRALANLQKELERERTAAASLEPKQLPPSPEEARARGRATIVQGTAILIYDCPLCEGSGSVLMYVTPHHLHVDCPNCNGTGSVIESVH